MAAADYGNEEALTRAFSHASGVFVLMPPNYDPDPGFPETVEANQVIRAALTAAAPEKIVVLSTVGAHAEQDNLLNNLKMSEESFRTLEAPVAFLRAAWFMENAAWDLADAQRGQVNSFLQPPEHPIPMIAVNDIGEAASRMLAQDWEGTRIVELEGPRRYTAVDIIQALADAFGHPVKAHFVPRQQWDALFRSQ